MARSALIYSRFIFLFCDVDDDMVLIAFLLPSITSNRFLPTTMGGVDTEQGFIMNDVSNV